MCDEAAAEGSAATEAEGETGTWGLAMWVSAHTNTPFAVSEARPGSTAQAPPSANPIGIATGSCQNRSANQMRWVRNERVRAQARSGRSNVRHIPTIVAYEAASTIPDAAFMQCAIEGPALAVAATTRLASFACVIDGPSARI
jgi:hypothetical protein